MSEIHIHPGLISKTGKVDLWDLEAKDGPVKVSLFVVDAKHALNFKDRYALKLPKGKQPGPAQIEAEQRAAAETDEPNRDPHFGANP